MELPYRKVKADLRIFLSIVMLLLLVGFVFVYSSSAVFALEKFGSAHYFLKKHAFYFGMGLCGFCIFAAVPLLWWCRLSPYLFLFSLGLTCLTFVPAFGLKMHGSNRWLSIGGISMQPSELLKLFLFMYLGFFLEKKQHGLKSFWRGYFPFLAILGIVSAVLLKQPDFGSVVTILSVAFGLFFVAQFRPVHLFYTVVLSLPAVAFLIMSKAYRMNRILIFLNPWSDPQGRGFQIIQSLIAIGSGQTWGLGVSNSKQKFFYLPMQHTDFIFSIIAEETGFVGAVSIVVMYALFCFYGLRLILRIDDMFTFFTSLGFILFISIQAAINLMVTTGVVPTKGLSLPFISYGGTALISLLCMIGFIVNAIRSIRIN
jgi:cell division protein FtsW